LQNFIRNDLCNVSRRRAQVRDRNPSRLRRDVRPSRPRLQKTGLETRLETETKSQDSIADIYSHTIIRKALHHFTATQIQRKSQPSLILLAYTSGMSNSFSLRAITGSRPILNLENRI